MGLREIAAADFAAITGNTNQWGMTITLTDPAGVVTPLVGITGDVAGIIDPDTGTAVTGRRTHIAIPIAQLPAGERPRHIPEDDQKPWLVSFARVGGTPIIYVVVGTMPDDTLGSFVCLLERYTL